MANDIQQEKITGVVHHYDRDNYNGDRLRRLDDLAHHELTPTPS